MVTVTVSGGEKYIVVPIDAMPEDSVSVIGLDGGETLASYAAAQGKELLLVGASLPYEELGIAQQSQTFRSISDNEMAILIQAEKRCQRNSLTQSAMFTHWRLEARMYSVWR